MAAASISTQEAASCYSGTWPAANRTGMTIAENGGIIEKTWEAVLCGELATKNESR